MTPIPNSCLGPSRNQTNDAQTIDVQTALALRADLTSHNHVTPWLSDLTAARVTNLYNRYVELELER